MLRIGFGLCVALLGATSFVAQVTAASEVSESASVSRVEAQPDDGVKDGIQGQRGEPVQDRVGVVTGVEFDGPTVNIDGLRFDFAADATVNFLSGYGAPTLLTPGMAVHIVHEAPRRTGRAGTILRLDEIVMEDDLLH